MDMERLQGWVWEVENGLFLEPLVTKVPIFIPIQLSS